MVDVKERTGLQVRILGPIEVDRDGAGVSLGSPKQRAVLAVLLTESRGSVGRDRIIEGVWGEDASEANRHSFHTYVSNLRTILGDVIVRAGDTYRLDIPSEDVDSRRFEETVVDARGLVATDPDGAATSLREALGWWRGLPFADLSDVPGLQAEIRRLEELRLEAVELRVDAELAAGAHRTLVAELEGLAEEHPFRERFRAQHMLALYRSGRQSEALRAYRRTEEFLAVELGVEPSRDLRDLELKILEQDEALLAAADRVVTQRLAFLVTDIEGSTALWDSHPQGMADALAVHDRVLREAIEGEGGRVFKHTGDGVLAVFPDSLSAVSAAEAAQRSLESADWGEVGELRVRMGIDVGDAEARGGDFYGPPLNRASRITAAGHGGQVLVSASANAEITAVSPAGVQIRQLGEHRFKGLVSPERIAQVVFVGLPADFPELRLDAEPALDDRVEPLTLPGYELRERIGEGAFGVVYRAYQPSVGREVAIKVIRPELADHPSFVRRFEAEARTVGRLAHPHIVPLIDFWREPAGAYLVLQLLPGGSLQSVLTDRVDRVAARRVLGHVGAGLDHAHSQGMVHGDLKPANVMLDGSGNAYLSDFGIVTRLLDPDLAMSLSSAPEFRAPEEAETGPSPAADLFALGVMAQRLFEGTPEVEPVLARATASTPEDRYRSAAEFLVELDEVLGEVPEDVDRPAVSRNPYKGLRAFDEADAADFYGRDELVATLVSAVSERRFVTVVGPSGSGKSSVVRAGLLPALARGAVEGSQHWFRVEMTPGPDPMASLSEAMETVATGPVDHAQLVEVGLRGLVDGEMLVAIDQFEELFTQVDSPELRQTFVDLITREVEDGGGRVRVVATLRADFYDRPLQDERLARLVRDGLVTVLPPTREELVEMITAPAQAVGLRWEPGLDHRIAEDVAHQPGGLPLLQYALTELVERRGGDLLTANDYINVGGVAGALATRAEAVYQNLTHTQQETARQILLRLVTVHEDTDDARRRVRRSELESVGIPNVDLDTVLDEFIGDRLLLADRDPTTRGPTVEVAHEALLREWPRLAGWVDDQREALILGRRFRSALADWEANDRHDDHLLTGHRLAPFIGWAETATLTGEEQEFYRASKSKDEAERFARRRRRRTLTGVLAGAAVVATVLGSIAAVQADRATTEAEAALAAEAAAEREAERATAEAERAEREAEAARAAKAEAEAEAARARASELSAFATAALNSDPTLAKLLALASARVDRPSLDTISVLHQVLATDSVVGRYVWPEDREVGFLWAHVSPDGTRLVAAGCGCDEPSMYLEVYDLEENEVLWWFEEVEDPRVFIDSPLFSPDGATAVAGLSWFGPDEPESGPLGGFIWAADTGIELRHFDLGRCGGTIFGVSVTHIVTDTILTDEGGCFFRGMAPPALQLIELESGAQRILTTEGWVAAMSGDGRYVAYDDQTVAPSVWVVEEVLSGRSILEVEVDDLGHGLTLNHDGSLLIVPRFNELEIWDVEARERVGSFDGHPAGVWSVAFSAANDDTVYSTGRAGALLHWDARTTETLASFPAVGNGWVSMSDTGLVVVTDQTARVASLIDTRTRGEIWAAETSSCEGLVLGSTTGVGGTTATFGEICFATDEVNTVLIDLASREVTGRVPGGRWQASKISPDGTRFARADVGDGPLETGDETWFGPIRVRDRLSGEILTELEGICTWELNLARSAGFDKLSEQEGCVRYPDTPFPVLPAEVYWSPDGNRIAVWNGPQETVLVWDAHSGELVTGYDGCDDIRGAYFDGDILVIYCAELDEARIILVDVATDEVRSVDIDRLGTEYLGIAGYTPDGSFLVGIRGLFGLGGGSLLWFDAETLEVSHELPRVHEGSPKSLAMSPSGSLVATGSSDGFIKVWNVLERRQVHEVYAGDTEIQGLAFIDEAHLAVVTQTGLFQIYTLDVDELTQIVAESLTREFTSAECEKYGFGDECPTMADLRNGGR